MNEEARLWVALRQAMDLAGVGVVGYLQAREILGCAMAPAMAAVNWGVHVGELRPLFPGRFERHVEKVEPFRLIQRRALPDKTCEFCGRTYQPGIATQRWCGDTCRRHASHRPEVEPTEERTCVICGSAFRQRTGWSRWRKRAQTCGRECLTMLLRRIAEEKRALSPRRRPSPRRAGGS